MNQNICLLPYQKSISLANFQIDLRIRQFQNYKSALRNWRMIRQKADAMGLKNSQDLTICTCDQKNPLCPKNSVFQFHTSTALLPFNMVFQSLVLDFPKALKTHILKGL